MTRAADLRTYVVTDRDGLALRVVVEHSEGMATGWLVVQVRHVLGDATIPAATTMHGTALAAVAEVAALLGVDAASAAEMTP